MKFVLVHFCVRVLLLRRIEFIIYGAVELFCLKSRHVLKGKQVEVLHDLVTVSREYTFDIGR